MWDGGTGRSVTAMHTFTRSHLIRAVIALAVAASLGALAVWTQSGQATPNAKAKTLRVFSTPASFTFTTADGKVTDAPPAGEPQDGDVLEVASLGFMGDHRRHAERSTVSDYVRCEFTAGKPACEGYAAVGGSLLRFRDMTVIGGAGRFLGATGKVVTTEVAGGSDIVVRLRLP